MRAEIERCLWWSLRIPHPFWWEEFVLRAAFLNPDQGDCESIGKLFGLSIQQWLKQFQRSTFESLRVRDQ